MHAFSEAESADCRRLVEMALQEDLGAEGTGDITCHAVIPPSLEGKAVFVARTAGVVAGLPAVELVVSTAATPLLRFQPLVEDGAVVRAGERLAVLSGLMEFILAAERTALNFLQRLSGVATLTRRYVDAIAGLPCVILDTRKTTPGWRRLEKYAVRCGGAQNHRMGLYDGYLIKDNHLKALGSGKQAFKLIIRTFSHGHLQPQVRKAPLEIEVESMDDLDLAFQCFPDIVLLDNMNPTQLREAVARRKERGFAKKVLLEASGGVNLETVRSIAETGVDRISVGALTHSAPALDIALDYELP